MKGVPPPSYPPTGRILEGGGPEISYKVHRAALTELLQALNTFGRGTAGIHRQRSGASFSGRRSPIETLHPKSPQYHSSFPPNGGAGSAAGGRGVSRGWLMSSWWSGPWDNGRGTLVDGIPALEHDVLMAAVGAAFPR